MLKFIFCTLSFFNILFSNNYQFVSQETDDLKDVLFYQDNIYLKDEKDNNYKLYLKGYLFDIKASYATGIIKDDSFYLFVYDNDELNLIRYYFDGTYEDSILIYIGKISGSIFLETINNSIYCAFTEFFNQQYNINLIYIDYSDNNIFIEEHFYGGMKNEKLIDMDSMNNELIFLVQKDQITESCFGNGGSDNCYVIAKIKDFLVESYITIDSNLELKYFCFKNDYIYLVLDNKIYLFNKDLESLNTKQFNEIENIFIGLNKNILIINSSNLMIIDAISLIEKEVKEISGISDLKEFTESLYCKYQDNYYLFDLIDYSKTLILNDYIYEYDELLDEKIKNVSSLFGLCLFNGKEYLEYYQRNLYGNYHLSIKYQTVGGIDFIKELERRVSLDVNINNNLIYPSGYRIIFNGEGYLDGNLILSNHQVNNPGKHNLVIKGTNTTKEFDFYISNNQYQFVDKYNDLELMNISKNEEFKIKYQLNEDINISDIIVIGGSIKNYQINDKVLEIVFNGFDKEGINKIILEKIIYEKDYYTDELYLNKVINLNVYNKGILFSDVNVFNDCSCSIEYLDPFKQARLIEFRFVNEKRDYLFTFPIGNQNIDITQIEKGKYQMFVSIRYDDLCYNLLNKEIYNMSVDVSGDLVIGKTSVINENDNYKINLDISNNFKENNILELKVKNDIVYNYLEFKKESTISYCISFFVVFVILGVCVRFLYKRNKNN